MGHPYVLPPRDASCSRTKARKAASNLVDRFDTIKVRLQTTKDAHFRGPVDCLMQTLRKEGVAGLYKGATPPLVGWMVMDSV